MMDRRSKLTVMQLPKTSTLIIRQLGDPTVFVSSYNVITIEIPALTFLIKFLVQGGFLSRKALEGILSELTEQ